MKSYIMITFLLFILLFISGCSNFFTSDMMANYCNNFTDNGCGFTKCMYEHSSGMENYEVLRMQYTECILKSEYKQHMEDLKNCTIINYNVIIPDNMSMSYSMDISDKLANTMSDMQKEAVKYNKEMKR